MTNKGTEGKENRELKDKAEIKSLFKSYNENRDKATRDKLIEKHIYIAEILSKKYANRGDRKSVV